MKTNNPDIDWFEQQELKDLTSVVAQDAITPFVGAGLSSDFGFKTWRLFLEEFVVTNKLTTKRTSITTDQEYDQILKDASKVPELFRREVCAYYGRKPQPAPNQNAVALLQNLKPGPILTTNYDNVIPSVFGNKLHADLSIHDQASRSAAASHRWTLIRLHGSASNYGDQIVATPNQYAEYYLRNRTRSIDFNKPLPGTLRAILFRRRVLFLGCSLLSERYLSVVKSAVDESVYPYHFALVPKHGNSQLDEKQIATLLRFKIKAIWYPKGNFSLQRTILRIALGLPPETEAMRRERPFQMQQRNLDKNESQDILAWLLDFYCGLNQEGFVELGVLSAMKRNKQHINKERYLSLVIKDDSEVFVAWPQLKRIAADGAIQKIIGQQGEVVDLCGVDGVYAYAIKASHILLKRSAMDSNSVSYEFSVNANLPHAVLKVSRQRNGVRLIEFKEI